MIGYFKYSSCNGPPHIRLSLIIYGLLYFNWGEKVIEVVPNNPFQQGHVVKRLALVFLPCDPGSNFIIVDESNKAFFDLITLNILLVGKIQAAVVK